MSHAMHVAADARRRERTCSYWEQIFQLDKEEPVIQQYHSNPYEADTSSEVQQQLMIPAG